MPLFPRATLTASDLTLYLIEAILPDGSSYILETGGEPLQYVRRPFVVRLSPSEPGVLVVNSFLERRARAELPALWEKWKIPRVWLESESPEMLERPPFVFRKIR